jgi:hypothetical protein
MSQSVEDAEQFRIERPYHGFLRLLMVGVGLFCIIVPAWELRFAFREIGWWTLFVGAIVVGAWSVGIPFLMSSAYGDRETWTFEGGTLRLDRASPLRQRVDFFRGGDVARMEIHKIDWDSKADTYSVVLHLRSGERLETPDYNTLARAEKIRAEISRRLRQDGGV